MGRAFRANNTFGSTTGWASYVIGQTGANSLTINLSALWVWTTWWRHARISTWRRCNRFFSAWKEWIPGISLWTSTQRNMFLNGTYCVWAACSNAWINTFVSNTSKMVWAVLVAFAFSSASTILVEWIALVSVVTEARSSPVTLPTFRIYSAWWWLARSWFWRTLRSCLKEIRFQQKYKTDGLGILHGGGIRPQCVVGSPSYPTTHVHTALWLITEHLAFTPQEPGQGSRHFSEIHAKLLGHSAFIEHSGRQFGDWPI